jgi:hypothetical protein
MNISIAKHAIVSQLSTMKYGDSKGIGDEEASTSSHVIAPRPPIALERKVLD